MRTFATLAKAESDDTGSGANGGDLGTFKRNSMVPEFEKTAFSLPVGQVSEPIKTQFGYHLIKVDKRDSPMFETLRTQIEERIKPEQARQTVELMAKNVNVVMNDAYFGPAQPAMMPAGPGAPPTPAAPAATPKESLTAPKPPASKPATVKPATPKTNPAK